MKNSDALHARAKALHLHGLLAHWPEATAAGWPSSLIDWEEDERARRSLERRLQNARIGRFKPLCDFDWNWPTAIDRASFEALMCLDFLKDATNAVLVGPNGVGKSTLARNLAHEALIHGHTVLFTSAGRYRPALVNRTVWPCISASWARLRAKVDFPTPFGPTSTALVASLRKSRHISASKLARSIAVGQFQSKSHKGLKRP